MAWILWILIGILIFNAGVFGTLAVISIIERRNTNGKGK